MPWVKWLALSLTILSTSVSVRSQISPTASETSTASSYTTSPIKSVTPPPQPSPSISPTASVELGLFVSRVSPNPMAATKTFTLVTINGSGFGLVSQPLPVVALGSSYCSPVTRLAPDVIQCTAAASFVGRQEVVVSLAGVSSNTAYVDRMCPEGLTGLPGEVCGVCPQGAVCGQYVPLPLPAPGFFPVSITEFLACVPSSACPGLQVPLGFGLDRFYEPDSTAIIPDSIPDDNSSYLELVNVSMVDVCVPGYSGFSCLSCKQGFYRVNQVCSPCPKNGSSYFVVSAFALGLAGVLAVFAKRYRISISALGIGVDFLQVVSLLQSFNFAWPPSLNALFRYASLSMFNVQVVAPECANHSFTFEARWYFTQTVPGLFMITYAMLYGVWFFVDMYVKSRKAKRKGRGVLPPNFRGRIVKLLDAYCGVVVIVMYYTYFLVVKGVFSLHQCVITSDNRAVLSVEPSFSCDDPPPALVLMRKWSIAFTVVYIVGIPGIFAVVLFSHRSVIRADQELRAKGKGNSRLNNPFFHVRQRYSKLYSIFRPPVVFWRLVLVARKLLIAAVALLLSHIPLFQASLALAVLFFSYVLHNEVKPFLDRLDLAVPQDSIDNVKSDDAVLGYVVAYNRLESTYLVSSIIILLCGMVFQSGYFIPGSSGYEGMTSVVAFLIIGSVVTFSVMMIVEVYKSVLHARRIHASRLAVKRMQKGVNRRAALKLPSTSVLRRLTLVKGSTLKPSEHINPASLFGSNGRVFRTLKLSRARSARLPKPQ